MNSPHDIGAHLASQAGGAGTAVAAGSGDATEVDGPWVDRTGFISCKLVITYKAVLADAESISFAANLQDATADDGTGAADFGDALANAIFATSSGGTTEEGVAELDIDLVLANQYIRAQVTPDLSASGTDTLTWAAAIVMGGAIVEPAVAP